MSILDKEIPQRWHKVWERIRPYRDEEVKKALEELQSDPAFNACLLYTSDAADDIALV